MLNMSGNVVTLTNLVFGRKSVYIPAVTDVHKYIVWIALLSHTLIPPGDHLYAYSVKHSILRIKWTLVNNISRLYPVHCNILEILCFLF